MAVIRLNPFAGLIPKADNTMLPETNAQVAENCRLTGGSLEPFNNTVQVYDPSQSGIQTIYRFGQNIISDTSTWFTFQNVVDVVKGPIYNDTEERTYYTGDGYPKKTNAALAISAAPYPANYYRLGVKAPTTAMNLAVTVGTHPAGAVAVTRYYVMTFVSAWKEESAPSPITVKAVVTQGDTVNLSGFPSIPADNSNVTLRRIYRTNVGTTGTDYQLVAEIPAANTTYDDSALDSELGYTLATIDSAVLPDDARGLTAMSNGIMAAHGTYDVYISEAYKPYSYPIGYRQTVGHPIVGIAAFGSALAVLTTGNPYLLIGSDPSSMSLEPEALPYSCVSKRSIITAKGGVIYASTDGLIQISGSGIVVLTDSTMTRREWAAYNPSSMLCVAWDDRIFAFYDNGTQGCLIFSDDQGITTSTIFATAAYADTVTGSLYLAVNNKIVKWDAGTSGNYRWKSKKFSVPKPLNFPFGQALAESYPVTVKVYADGVLKITKTVTDDKPFRLPSGFLARYWEIELSGSSKIIAAYLASTITELQNG